LPRARRRAKIEIVAILTVASRGCCRAGSRPRHHREVRVDETLRQRLLRHLEALPEERLYQALDYIEFLSSRYAERDVRAAPNAVQRFNEALHDRLRAQNVGIAAMKGTLAIAGAAGRAINGITEAGRTLARQVEGATAPPPPRAVDPAAPGERARALPPRPGDPVAGTPPRRETPPEGG
jgi:hypothetical protein